MTPMMCPHGCGGIITDLKLAYCPSCRRDLNTVEVKLPGTCWQWFGPSHHRMQCRKKVGHKTAWHSTHDDCGAQNSELTICGFEDEHEGRHSWELAGKE